MKYLNLSQKFLWINIIFFIFHNSCFGWNELPLSELEKTCDFISKWGLSICVLIYLVPLFEIYEDTVKKRDYEK